MQKTVMILDANETHSQSLCALIEKGGFCRALPQRSLPEMEAHIQCNECQVVMIDIDTVPIDNRTIREMTIKYPGVYFLCLSTERFHPDLKEALCYHIYACIKKPVDPDEVYYWIKSIFANGNT